MMKTLILFTFLFIGYNLSAQIKIDPNKIKEKANKEVKTKTSVEKKEQKSNSLNNNSNVQQINRKRPGGTVKTSPSAVEKKEGEPTPKKEGDEI